jgi:hypothetical protein
MIIENYAKRDAFSPECLSCMGEAFVMAMNALQIADDKPKKVALAKFIVQLAQDGDADNPADMRDRAIKAFGAPAVLSTPAPF